MKGHPSKDKSDTRSAGSSKFRASHGSSVLRRCAEPRSWQLALVVVAIAVAGNLAAVAPSGATSKAGKALSKYFKQVNADLQSCIVGIGTTQIELGYALKANATPADLVNLYSAARQAEGPCDIAQNNNLLNLGSYNPPSGYPSLNNFSLEIQIWADSDSVTVLKDVEALANHPSSTSAASNLILDAQSADAAAHQLNAWAARAAKRDHVKNTGGDMLLYWNLSTK